MFSTVSIPYYASKDSLPRALPSTAEILNTPDVLSRIGGCKVVRIRPHFVVKFGTSVDAIEGQNLLFVAERTSILVPQVYAIYVDRKPETQSQRTFIVMQNVEGNTLAKEWSSMNVQQKKCVTGRLAGYMRQLRKIPTPGYYGCLGKSHLREGIFWTGEGENRVRSICGPFTTESEVNNAMIEKYQHIAQGNKRLDHKGEFYRRSMPRIFRDHPPVFTHADLQRKNVIVQKMPRTQPTIAPKEEVFGMWERIIKLARCSFVRVGRCQEQSMLASLDDDDYKVTLIDWELAGWYPSYWEYCGATAAFSWEDDWDQWIEQIIEPYYAEYPWMQMIRSELWS